MTQPDPAAVAAQSADSADAPETGGVSNPRGGKSDDAPSRRKLHAGVAVGAVGAGLVLGGTLLAAYSRFWSEGRDLSDWAAVGRDWLGKFRIPTAGLSESWGAFALVIGVIMLAVVADLVRRASAAEPSDRVSTWVFGIGAAALALGGYALSQHLIGVVDDIGFYYPLFDRLPTAAGAILLILLGAILAIGLCRPAAVRAAGKRTLVIGAAAGLLISAGVAGTAVYAGDDDRRVDHTTVAAVPVPAAPTRLGTERYRVPVPLMAISRQAGDIATAGTGFVLADTAGLTAYDGATGAPRWHYRRSDVVDGDRNGVSYVSGSLLSADGGTVVLAQWYNAGLTAFDAITGELLWTRSEFADATGQLLVDSSRFESEQTAWRPVLAVGDGPGTLAATDGSRLARFDARTGNRMWVVELCRANHWYVAVTGVAISRIAHCGANRGVVTALDPVTGAVIGERTWELREHDGGFAPQV
ncbi:PQQ-like beta-propeller repeat protein [Nocardia yamanashiensis]|uniref:outer membrane protein assembly factor BamB family protein n=1 Tax=Nocardia yamanashiensis TaxID=209247 RepID=UPI001E3E93FC|nr:PQQ-binding-like beta-propeller repeat protein [Nocardia yamanashiensis]UGT41123.1 PQQ-like beta-propeller repeat protein [Nocardia yamanashiensis]